MVTRMNGTGGLLLWRTVVYHKLKKMAAECRGKVGGNPLGSPKDWIPLDQNKGGFNWMDILHWK